MTFVQIFYAELEKNRDRYGNFSHSSAHIVEVSAHVHPYFQAPVHPWWLTCSLVWNQLQKAAVVLCYFASPILKAAIKAWRWLKAIQLAVTVKQKPRVNWNLFFLPPPPHFHLEAWRRRSSLPSWEVFWGVRVGGRWCPHRRSLVQWRRDTRRGIQTREREVFSLRPAQLLCCLLKMHGAQKAVPRWMACDVLPLNCVVVMKSP